MNEYEAVTRGLCEFIAASPTCYHVIDNAGRMLREQGFLPLSEHCQWDLKPGQAYYVTRSGSSLMAFVLPEGRPSGFQIIASHSDSPAFKIKESPEISKAGHYVVLNIEKYWRMKS